MKRAARGEGEHERQEKKEGEKKTRRHVYSTVSDEEESLAGFGLEGQIPVFETRDFVEPFCDG